MNMIITTTPSIPGYRIVRVLGIVSASSIRTRGAGGRLLAGLEAIAGGRGESYLKEVEKARMEALELLQKRAKDMGANAIIGVDFETAEVLEGFIMISVYGTAVHVVKEDSLEE